MKHLAATLRRTKRDMREFLELSGKTAVVLFVAFHMGAVLAFSLPADARDPISRSIRSALRPRIAPYMLVTSQWQEWNLFAPDPLRAVQSYSVDAEDGVRWKTVADIGPGTFPWWRHATYAKLLPAILKKERNDFDVFRERFLQMMCNDLGIPDGTLVRLRENEYVLPYLEGHEGNGWWESWEPADASTVIRTTNCHPSAL